MQNTKNKVISTAKTGPQSASGAAKREARHRSVFGHRCFKFRIGRHRTTRRRTRSRARNKAVVAVEAEAIASKGVVAAEAAAGRQQRQAARSFQHTYTHSRTRTVHKLSRHYSEHLVVVRQEAYLRWSAFLAFL